MQLSMGTTILTPVKSAHVSMLDVNMSGFLNVISNMEGKKKSWLQAALEIIRIILALVAGAAGGAM